MNLAALQLAAVLMCPRIVSMCYCARRARPVGARDGKGRENLVERLAALDVSLIVLEAKGGFETTVAAALASARLPLAVVNPRQIWTFAKVLGEAWPKTDRIDAEAVAPFAGKVLPQVRTAATPQAQALSERVARRRQGGEMIGMEANRRRSAAVGIDARVRHARPARGGRHPRLCAGCWSRHHENPYRKTPERGGLDRRKLAALAGVAPFNRDSGAWRGPRMIAGGRTSVRNVPSMAGLAALRQNPAVRVTTQRLVRRGRPKKAAITGCLRQLLIILNAMVRTKSAWKIA